MLASPRMNANAMSGHFPSVEELSLGMARMKLAGELVPKGSFDSVEALAEKLDRLNLKDQLKLAGLISVWLVCRHNPFTSRALLKSHINCSSLEKAIYRADKKKCARTAKVFMDRGTLPDIRSWEDLFECAVGLLMDCKGGSSHFRASLADALVRCAGGTVEVDGERNETGAAMGGEETEEEESFENVLDKATRKTIEEAVRQSKRRRGEALDAALKLRDSYAAMSALGGQFANMPAAEKTRWITTYSKCLQPILDLSEGKRLYDYILFVGSRG
ncbi:matrix protein [Quaranjavirus johnstonense]|uniref:Matrix protein n=1 Tax=Quaranjavirus johnstonense TaxID=688437 RepID=A0A6B9XKE1_9ORTO|nr:matrix protein [Quaranjavirus johnstonense]QHR77129.1 matrix protein [Quaranjavirus johnstonense]